MKIAAERIAQGLAITSTVRAEIYGNPGPVLGQVREAAFNGTQISIKPGT